MTPPINLFYAEPDFDRWLRFDRFPRRLVRRLVRGAPRPGGQMRVFLNLKAGLDRLGIRYRENDHRHARRHPDELCCVLGKRHVLDGEWRNPLMVGPCIHSHPLDDPNLLQRRRVRRILVPGEWMRRMCEPDWNGLVHAWPVGIDTERWAPAPEPASKDIDVLIYDKLRWKRSEMVPTLLESVTAEVARHGLRSASLRYGFYREEEFERLLQRSRSMVFLCEHETQGIAYQQALSAGVPILAWDHAGEWADPEYYPQRVRFGPVSSVPYWDERCGMKFRDATELPALASAFFDAVERNEFRPRDYIVENLSLEQCAREFVAHCRASAAGDS